MPNLTDAFSNVAIGDDALFCQHRPATTTSPPAPARCSPTRPAATTSPPAPRRWLQHDRQLQRRHRHRRAEPKHDRRAQRRHRLSALESNTTGFENVATGLARCSRTRPATPTSRPASPRAELQHHRQRQRRHRPQRADCQHDRQQQRRRRHRRAVLNTTGSANVAIGRNAGQNLTTGSNNVDIANAGVAGESGTIRIGIPTTRPPRSSPGSGARPSAGRPSRWSSTQTAGSGPRPRSLGVRDVAGVDRRPAHR